MPSVAKVFPQSSNKKLVLCIDDYKQGLHARRLILETAGYDVITASSGRIGLRHQSVASFDEGLDALICYGAAIGSGLNINRKC